MRSDMGIAALAALVVSAATAWGEAEPRLGSDVANTITHISEGLPFVAAAGLTLFGKGEADDTGRHIFDSLAVTGLVVTQIKEGMRAHRPDNPGSATGFPSGHAAVNFAMARCIEEEYPTWGKVGYLWASTVCWSRYRRRDHSLDQVIAGALIGTYIAERSLASEGGLLDGLIVGDHHGGFAPEFRLGADGPDLQLWCQSW